MRIPRSRVEAILIQADVEKGKQSENQEPSSRLDSTVKQSEVIQLAVSISNSEKGKKAKDAGYQPMMRSVSDDASRWGSAI